MLWLFGGNSKHLAIKFMFSTYFWKWLFLKKGIFEYFCLLMVLWELIYICWLKVPPFLRDNLQMFACHILLYLMDNSTKNIFLWVSIPEIGWAFLESLNYFYLSVSLLLCIISLIKTMMSSFLVPLHLSWKWFPLWFAMLESLVFLSYEYIDLLIC